MTVLLDAYADWYCPNCGFTERTKWSAQNRWHPCAKLPGSMSAPMIRQGQEAKVYVREREDYIADETVRLTGGRPVMSLITERPDGSNDVVVFAPTATVKGSM